MAKSYQYLLGKVSTESFMDGDPYRIVYQYLLGKVSTLLFWQSFGSSLGINIY